MLCERFCTECSTHTWSFPERLWVGFWFGRMTVPGNESKHWSDWEGQEEEGGRVTCASQVSLLLFSTEVQGLTGKSSVIHLPRRAIKHPSPPQDIMVIWNRQSVGANRTSTTQSHVGCLSEEIDKFLNATGIQSLSKPNASNGHTTSAPLSGTATALAASPDRVILALPRPLPFPFQLGNCWVQALVFHSPAERQLDQERMPLLTFCQASQRSLMYRRKHISYSKWISIVLHSPLENPHSINHTEGLQHSHTGTVTVILVPYSPSFFPQQDKHENSAANTQKLRCTQM